MPKNGNLKILVIRFSSLGDVVLTTALFPNLKKKYSSAEITLLTRKENNAIFNRNPHVDKIINSDNDHVSFSELTKKIRQTKYDILIDLQGNLKSWFIRLVTGAPKTIVVEKLSWARQMLVLFKIRSAKLNRTVRERILDCLKPLEAPVLTQETMLFPGDPEKTLKSFSLNSKMKFVGIAPGARHNTKKWNAAKFTEVANRLGAENKTMVLILGSKEDQAVAKQVSSRLSVPFRDLTGWTHIDDLISIVSRLSMLVTNDSALLHIGEALKIPLVAIFGPTVRQLGFAPYQKTSRVVEVVNLKCRPCSLHGDEKCPLGHHKCMEDIDPNAVLFATSMAQGKSE